MPLNCATIKAFATILCLCFAAIQAQRHVLANLQSLRNVDQSSVIFILSAIYLIDGKELYKLLFSLSFN
jgi:hypothetical protein